MDHRQRSAFWREAPGWRGSSRSTFIEGGLVNLPPPSAILGFLSNDAVLIVDQAGWHLSARLVVPANTTILALPRNVPSSTLSRTSGRVHARQLALQSRLQIL